MFNKYEVNLRSITKMFLFLVLVSLVGFTLVDTDLISKEEIKMIEETVAAENETATNSSILKFTDKGHMVASWYGPRFHGRLTANGEIFNEMAYTAAHKDLRFGTLLKVTNTVNNKSVIVRINDRGPYIPGRHLDLSKAAAMSLGIINRGVMKVQVEQVSLKGVNFPVIALN
jgi:rare lipoprotein A